jgi:serine phosphatase RsbU (regulator of sigma subunit)
VLDRLNQVVKVFEGNTIITALYGVLDPSEQTWTYAAAGHPPVVVRHSDGTTRLLDEPNDPPLGAATEFHARQVELEAGATLVLYTDGLIERRAEPITTGFGRLLDTCSNGPAEPAALCDHLLSVLLGDHLNEDDVAMLAVTLT